MSMSLCNFSRSNMRPWRSGRDGPIHTQRPSYGAEVPRAIGRDLTHDALDGRSATWTPMVVAVYPVEDRIGADSRRRLGRDHGCKYENSENSLTTIHCGFPHLISLTALPRKAPISMVRCRPFVNVMDSALGPATNRHSLINAPAPLQRRCPMLSSG